MDQVYNVNGVIVMKPHRITPSPALPLSSVPHFIFQLGLRFTGFNFSILVATPCSCFPSKSSDKFKPTTNVQYEPATRKSLLSF